MQLSSQPRGAAVSCHWTEANADMTSDLLCHIRCVWRWLVTWAAAAAVCPEGLATVKLTSRCRRGGGDGRAIATAALRVICTASIGSRVVRLGVLWAACMAKQQAGQTSASPLTCLLHNTLCTRSAHSTGTGAAAGLTEAVAAKGCCGSTVWHHWAKKSHECCCQHHICCV